MRIFGIDPGSVRTGYGCVEADGRRVRLVTCGAITARTDDEFPQRLARIHRELSSAIESCHPDSVAVESVFHASNVHSALKLGHARGVAILAAFEAGCPVVEYAPAEIKRAVVGYGRAEKHQVRRAHRSPSRSSSRAVLPPLYPLFRLGTATVARWRQPHAAVH